MKPPAFQFYADDFIAGVVALSPHEAGCYIRLLCFQWSSGRIPTDVKTLEKICGGKVSKAVIKKFLRGKNARLETERKKQLEYRDKQRQKGVLSAKARFNHGSTTVQPSGEPEAQPKGNSPSPSPSPISIKTTKLPASVKNGSKFNEAQTDLTGRIHAALSEGWENDRQKWMGRIKNEFQKSERVISELESAIKESRIKTTPAQYAEQTWKEFK